MSKAKFNTLCAKYESKGWTCTLRLSNVAVFQAPNKTTFATVGKIGG